MISKSLLQKLARKHGTPLFVIDHDELRKNYQQFRKYLPRVQVYFAVKANSDPAIVSAAPPLSAASTSNLAVPVLALKLQATRAADVNLVADGKTVFSGHLNPGDAKDLTATGSIQISSSEASAVLLDLNGKMVVLPGQPGQPSAITLTPKDLPSPAGASH